MQWPFIGCAIFLLAACYTDFKSMKIPNPISITCMVSGLAVHVGSAGLKGLWLSLGGFTAGFGLMLILYIFGAVGGGDVKLFGGIGAWTGVAFTLSSLFYSVLAAGCIGFVVLLFRREMISGMKKVWRSVFGAVMLRSLQPLYGNKQEMLRFPFMAAVVPGVLLAYFYM